MNDSERSLFVPINYEMLSNKKIKIRCFLNVLDNSVYYPEEDRRKLSSDKYSYSKIGKILDLDRRTVSASMNEMFKKFPQMIEQTEDGDIIIYNNQEDGQYRISTLSHRMIRDLYTCFNDNVIKLYFYLYRQYSYWTQVKKQPGFDFSLKTLCEALGYSSQSGKNYKNIRSWLAQLLLNKMIGYVAIEKQTKYGPKIYYRLLYITDYVPIELIMEEQGKSLDQCLSADITAIGGEKIIQIWGEIPQEKLEDSSLPPVEEELCNDNIFSY